MRECHPLLRVSIEPRATIRRVIDRNPRHLVYPLTCIAGFFQVIGQASTANWGDSMSLGQILAIAAIGGAIGGVIGLFVGAMLLRWTGRWLGGTGSLEQLRAAVAWSNVPVVIAGLLWLPAVAIADEYLFHSQQTTAINGLTIVYLMLTGIAEAAASVWGLVVLCQCVGEVQGFSAWRGLANTLLASAVLMIPILLFAVFSGLAQRL